VQYLHNTQRVEREQSVEIWFWGMPRAQIEACMPTAGACHEGEVPAGTGLPDPVEGGFNALLAMAAARPPREQLAPDRLRVGWHARLVTRWAFGLAAAVLLLGCGFAALLSRENGALHRETQTLRDQNAELAASRNDIDARLATHHLDLDDMLILPAAASRLRQSDVPLSEVLSLAGRIFGTRPALRLDSLDFQVSSPTPDAAPAGRECAKETVTAPITLAASFSLTSDLDVRRRADALAHVRTQLSRAAPWQSTSASAQVGESSPLTVKAGAGELGDTDQWSICLTRGEAA
jgi:hypothetical protein